MTVPYLLRFCPYRALMCMLFGMHTQGVASLALGYVLVGLSARLLPSGASSFSWLVALINSFPSFFSFVFRYFQ